MLVALGETYGTKFLLLVGLREPQPDMVGFGVREFKSSRVGYFS